MLLGRHWDGYVWVILSLLIVIPSLRTSRNHATLSGLPFIVFFLWASIVVKNLFYSLIYFPQGVSYTFQYSFPYFQKDRGWWLYLIIHGISGLTTEFPCVLRTHRLTKVDSGRIASLCYPWHSRFSFHKGGNQFWYQSIFILITPFARIWSERNSCISRTIKFLKKKKCIVKVYIEPIRVSSIEI